MTAYRLLFRIDIRHEFFADGACRALACVPVPETATLIARRGLLLRTTPSGVAVFAESAARSAIAPTDDLLAFTFSIGATDAAFWNYTDPGGAAPETVFVFDSDCAVADADGGLRLHRTAWADAGNRLDVHALLGALSGRDLLVPPLALATVGVTAADLESHPEGRSFYIAFRARRTHWKYYVLGMEEPEPPLSIRDADGEIEFIPGTPHRLPDNRRALTLRSSAPIALQERPQHRFQLRANGSGGEKVLVRRLPVASPDRLGKEEIRGREVVVSEIYVNL